MNDHAITSIDPYIEFAIKTLMPTASTILKNTYHAYKAGENIDIQTKDDNSPASAADREAEYAIRRKIVAEYPKHGIWGEEYGTHQLDADYVWVLDPLDGTKEFIAKNPHHFGLLIGLFHMGKPIFGLIHDPINAKTWNSSTITKHDAPNSIPLKESSIACTRRTMFDGLPNKTQILSTLNKCKKEHIHLNCIGFAKVADGDITAVIEHDLNLHDIAAVLPVLHAAGARVVDFKGRDYKDYDFNFDRYGQRDYSIIASLDHALVDQILKEIR